MALREAYLEGFSYFNNNSPITAKHFRSTIGLIWISVGTLLSLSGLAVTHAKTVTECYVIISCVVPWSPPPKRRTPARAGSWCSSRPGWGVYYGMCELAEAPLRLRQRRSDNQNHLLGGRRGGGKNEYIFFLKTGCHSDVVWFHLICSWQRGVTPPKPHEPPPPACTPTAGDAVYCIFKAVSWNAFDEYSVLLWCIWKHAWRLHEDMLFSNREAQVVFGKKKK